MKRKPLDTNEIIDLLLKGLAETCDEKEHEQLEDWLSTSSDHERIFVELRDKQYVRSLGEDQQAYQTGQAYERIAAQLQPTKTVTQRLWLRYAAAILILALAAGWWMLKLPPQRGGQTVALQEEILPGGNRATLTLADGRRVELSEAQAGIVINDQDIKYIDGSTVLGEKDGQAGSLTSHLMSITTPKGGTYHITLPDGSKVWLNAGSTLRYPPQFSGDARIVELEGEAYFEVRPQTIYNRQQTSLVSHLPFKVVTKGQTVEVLGTEFNVSAYPGESKEATTLVTGAVRVKSQLSGQADQLTPGQQGALRNGAFTTNEVDVANFTAWKDGRFNFDDKTFDEVMRELGRWYDLDIVYEGPIPDKSFYGGAYRNDRFSIVMRLLRSADIDYKLQDNKLIIKSIK